MFTVSLPWPDSRLYAGNSRIHFRLRAELARGARHDGRMLAAEALGGRLGPFQMDDSLRATFTFSAPDARRRDLVNCADACKSYVDGIFDALGVNDSQIRRVLLEWSAPMPNRGGQVVIELERINR